MSMMNKPNLPNVNPKLLVEKAETEMIRSVHSSVDTVAEGTSCIVKLIGYILLFLFFIPVVVAFMNVLGN